MMTLPFHAFHPQERHPDHDVPVKNPTKTSLSCCQHTLFPQRVITFSIDLLSSSLSPSLDLPSLQVVHGQICPLRRPACLSNEIYFPTVMHLLDYDTNKHHDGVGDRPWPDGPMLALCARRAEGLIGARLLLNWVLMKVRRKLWEGPEGWTLM